MLKHNVRGTSLDYMEVTLSYHALKGRYDIGSAKVFRLLSTSDKWQSTPSVRPLRFKTIGDEPIIRPVSQQVYHSGEMHFRAACRSITLTSLRAASEDLRLPNFEQLIRAQIDKNSGLRLTGLVRGYDRSVHLDCIFIKLRNGLLYYHQPYQTLLLLSV
jgi:hypothetical protein